MKECPQCRATYADDGLNFCLSDGAPLLVLSSLIEEQTIVRPSAPPPPRQGVHPVFAYLTVGVFALLIGGGIVAWLMYGGSDKPPGNYAGQGNIAHNGNREFRSANINTGGNKSVPTLPDHSVLQSEVNTAFQGWVDSLESHDLTGHLTFYDEKLSVHYKKSNADISYVRDYNEKLFNKYSSFRLEVKNLTIEIDPAGDKARTLFDSAFNFKGSAASHRGVSRTEIGWRKVGGVWKIESERTLKKGPGK
jgi:hypothetical protein